MDYRHPSNEKTVFHFHLVVNCQTAPIIQSRVADMFLQPLKYFE